MRRPVPVLVAALLAALGTTGRTQSLPNDAPRREVSPPADELRCGTRHVEADDVVRHGPRLSRPDGELLWFRQEPALLTANYAGELKFRGVTVTGDVTRVRFARYDRRSGAETIETWSRTGTSTVDGQLVSLFDPSWDADYTAYTLRSNDRGIDQPTAYFGRFLGPDDGIDDSVSMSVRFGVLGLPAPAVTVIDETAQYASHVVNLVIPTFGDGRVGDDYGFDLEAAAKAFYAHFDDSYEILSFVPVDSHPSASYAAFHRDVQNAILGTGGSRFSRATRYGSNGRLLGVELFATGAYAENRLANHELTHTWGHNYDWASIAGVTTPDAVHTPLMNGGESLVSRILSPWLRVGGTAEAPVIERTPVPARHHPLEMYAMGLIEPNDIPPMRLLINQWQFVETRPAAGVELEPAHRTATIDDILRTHGPRQGPVYREINRATVVVSRDRLLSAEEMAYWNFVAARLEDPNRTGIVDYDGQPSFDVSTGLAVDVKTAIRPKDREPATSSYDLDYPTLDPRECMGVTFDAPVPTRFTVGQRIKLNGRVTATDRTDFSSILLRYWRAGGASANALRAQAEVSHSGLFNTEFEFRDGQEGVYLFEVFLFWPNAPTQWSRCSLTTVRVDPSMQPAQTIAGR